MRISDWSSDVCSSDLRRDERGERGGDFARAGILQRDDLAGRAVAVDAGGERADAANIVGEIGDDEAVGVAVRGERALRADERTQRFDRRQIGRASCRERVWQYV